MSYLSLSTINNSIMTDNLDLSSKNMGKIHIKHMGIDYTFDTNIENRNIISSNTSISITPEKLSDGL
ncbi:MAG: hypothetical protein ACP5RS_05690 [Thermoplasmata archaeon]